MRWLKNADILKFLLLTWILLICGRSDAAAQSVLATGQWYKIGVTESGIYEIDVSFLKKIGAEPVNVNPAGLRIFGNPGGLLPQRNDVPRQQGLREQAIMVTGAEDGRFDQGDKIWFYAEGPHKVFFDSTKNVFSHQTNIYSDTAFYYLQTDGAAGLRVPSKPSVSSSAANVNAFDDYWYHEVDATNILRSGREWLGEYLGSTALTIQAAVPGVIVGSPMIYSAAAVAASQVNTRFQWQVDGKTIGETSAGTVTTSLYDVKGLKSTARFAFSNTTNSIQSVGVVHDKNGQASGQGYLDFIAIQVKRELKAYDSQQIYRFGPGNGDIVTYNFGTLPTGFQCWDVSVSGEAKALVLTNGGFSVNGGKSYREFIGFTPAQVFTPASWEKVRNQSIRTAEVPELLIVTAGQWSDAAESLAEFRRSNDRMSVLVVTTDQIYNEFSAGRPDATAIRDFIRFQYQRTPGQLKHVLLFGDASYDYRNLLQNQTKAQHRAWVPVYESRESLNPVYTYSSDDYFGFMDDDEGDWVENSSGDHTQEVAIGRLPVKHLQEAQIVVDKLIHYASPASHGPWRNRIRFVADDGDGGIHQEHADRLANLVEPELWPQRTFVDAFSQTTTSLGQKVPEVNVQIRRSIDEGTLILNYTGHGGTSGWAEEQIMTLGDMQGYRGYNNLPLLITATCDFGRYDDPGLVSGGEYMVLSPRGAAIGSVSTTRPVYSSTNFTINKAFYDAFTTLGKEARLGDLMVLTKNNSHAGSLNRNFTLLGDPSMKLARGERNIRWTEKPDTLKAVGRTTLKGLVSKPGSTEIDATFNGRARVTVFDKKGSFRTMGTEGSSAQTFAEFNSKLFEGDVTVANGQFSCTFVMPKDIDYRYGTGRVSVYAVSSDSLTDASAQLNVVVGGSARLEEDNTPPILTGYLNSPNFRDGDEVDPNPTLFLKMSDQNGISVSKAGTGHAITLTLNDTMSITLNDYYVAEVDQYSSGNVVYRFHNLPEGSYTARTKVWDTYNNSSELAFAFQVGRSKGLSVTSLNVFPNPFYQDLSFELQHNRENDDIEVTMELYDVLGRKMSSSKWQYYNSEATIKEILPVSQLNLSGILPAKYIYLLRVRSLNDHSTGVKSGNLLRTP